MYSQKGMIWSQKSDDLAEVGILPFSKRIAEWEAD
jgi:hypothetical protein